MKRWFWNLVYSLSPTVWFNHAPQAIRDKECLLILRKAKLSGEFSPSECNNFDGIEDAIRRGEFFG